MPNYNYICSTCTASLAKKLGREPLLAELIGSEECPGAIFETYHTMFPSPAEQKKASQCPMCDGNDTEVTLLGSDVSFYSKGFGWLDKSGIKRDMNLFKLVNDDPYDGQRQAGEKDDLATRLRRGPQKKVQVFDTKPKVEKKPKASKDAS